MLHVVLRFQVITGIIFLATVRNSEHHKDTQFHTFDWYNSITYLPIAAGAVAHLCKVPALLDAGGVSSMICASALDSGGRPPFVAVVVDDSVAWDVSVKACVAAGEVKPESTHIHNVTDECNAKGTLQLLWRLFATSMDNCHRSRKNRHDYNKHNRGRNRVL